MKVRKTGRITTGNREARGYGAGCVYIHKLTRIDRRRLPEDCVKTICADDVITSELWDNGGSPFTFIYIFIQG